MFFDIFNELCKAKPISCKRAAEDMGLSNSITTKWKKTGATPSGETLEKVANYFGVTTDYLLGKEPAHVEQSSSITDLFTGKQGTSENKKSPVLTEEDERLIKQGVLAQYARNGLTESEALMLQLFRQIPDDKKEAALEILRSTVKMF